jgi:hypothetical protein
MDVHVMCYRKDTNTDPMGDGAVALGFQADPTDARNQFLLGTGYITMSVTPVEGLAFEVGQAYTLTLAAAD